MGENNQRVTDLLEEAGRVSGEDEKKQAKCCRSKIVKAKGSEHAVQKKSQDSSTFAT